MEFTKKALIVAAIVFVLIVAMGQFKTKTALLPVVTPTPVPTITSTDDTIRDAFVKGCAKEDTTVAFCNCGYNYIVKAIGVEGMIKLGLRINDNTTTSEDKDLINDAAFSCSNLYRN